jgi:hypothetical protein
MRKTALFLVAVLLLFFFVQASFAQMAPQEFSYGEQGTRELGLNGSIILPTEITVEGESDDDGTTTISLQPFFKYFFQDRIHAGAQLLIQSSTTEQDGADDIVTTVTVFAPHIGYTFPLSPRFQLDGQLNLGFTSVEYSDQNISESAISYGFSLMGLSPITESAVVGAGIIFNWTTIDVDGTDVEIFTRVIPIQVSFYF